MKINDDVIKVIIEQAKKDAPIESCGLLLGKDDVVTESYWMENIDHSEEHFAFAPKDQFAALKYARSKGLKILANWHSHLHRLPAHRRKTFGWLTIPTSVMPSSHCSTERFTSIHSRY